MAASKNIQISSTIKFVAVDEKFELRNARA